MSIEPSFPVFFLDGADVIVIERVADLPVEVDPVLVDSAVTLVDASGRRLRKVVSQPARRRWRLFQEAPEIVGVEVVPGEDEADLLRRKLTVYLEATGVQIKQADDIETFAREAAQQIR